MVRTLLGAFALGTVFVFAPAAQAYPCVVCDWEGCPRIEDPCPYGGDGSGAAAFTGNAHINCFGCGSSTGTASLSVAGIVGTTFVDGSESASFTVVEGTGPTCVISGSASGSATGALNLSFTWTRLGAVAVVTTVGDIDGAGLATFVVTSPVGNPCGRSADVSVVGSIAGP